MGPEGVQQYRCEPEVPLHELCRILGSIHPREVEHEVRLRAPSVQFLGRRVEVVLEDLVNGHAVVLRLPVPDILQLRTKVLTHEPLGAGHKYFHYLTIFGIPFNSFWMYSREAIFAFVSSRFRRFVLSELNSSIVARLTSPSTKYLS